MHRPVRTAFVRFCTAIAALGLAAACGLTLADLLLASNSLGTDRGVVAFWLASVLWPAALWLSTGFVVRGCFVEQRSALRPAGLALVVGGLLSVVIPIRPSPPLRHTRIEIIATGNANPLATAAHVYVGRLTLNDGRRFPPASPEFQLSPDWRIRPEGDYAVTRTAGAAVVWEGSSDGVASLDYVTGPFCGRMRVSWNGREEEIDSYAPPEMGAGGTRTRISIGERYSRSWAHRLTEHVLHAIALGLPLLLALVLLEPRRPRPAGGRIRAAWVSIYWYALPSLVVWTIPLLAFWPAIMSRDSFDQWTQAVTGHYDNGHPVIHTLLIGAVIRVCRSPAAVVIVQVASLSAAVGWGCVLMRRWGAGRLATASAACLVALHPLSGQMVVSIWKDVPFTVAVLLLTLMIGCAAMTEGSWLDSPGSAVALGVATALVASFRYNGLMIAGGVLLSLWIVFWAWWRRLAVATLLFALLFVTLRWGAESVAGAKSRENYYLAVSLALDIAGIHGAGGRVTPEEADRFQSLFHRDLVVWQDRHPYSVTASIDGDAEYDVPTWEVLTLWSGVVARNPLRWALLRGGFTSWALRIVPAQGEQSDSVMNPVDFASRFPDGSWCGLSSLSWSAEGLHYRPVWPRLSRLVGDALASEWLREQQWWVSRPAGYLAGLLVLVLLATWSESVPSRIWLVAVPSLLLVASLFAYPVSPQSRYAFPIPVTSLLLSPWLVSRIAVRHKATARKTVTSTTG